MKKAYISPVTSLLMSLSLALGILVSDYSLLTSAHAQAGNPCGVSANGATVISDTVSIGDGLILSGIIVRNITVNGAFLEQAVIAGNVQLTNVTVTGTAAFGVIVGSGSPCYNGVIVGSGNPAPTVNGVIVGSGSPVISGMTGTASGTAVGGTLTGDGITITDGVVTGQNLLLSGAVIDEGSINGTITSISLPPSN